MSKTMIMGIAAGLMALTALHAPAAEAKKGLHKPHKHHKHHVLKWAVPYHYAGYKDCGYYFWRWQHTGKGYWKSKYFACKAFY